MGAPVIQYLPRRVRSRWLGGALAAAAESLQTFSEGVTPDNGPEKTWDAKTHLDTMFCEKSQNRIRGGNKVASSGESFVQGERCAACKRQLRRTGDAVFKPGTETGLP